ncbi:MAG: Flp pilus assembly complex ATPase component TadA [Bacilli bacterium]|jgi:competence protein ComGA/type IV pilus assembly protein PilB|nr:Flp pilus assembly complex ATPase component TadA [Bacilli bacterium]
MNKLFSYFIKYAINNYCSDLHFDIINNEYCIVAARKLGNVLEIERLSFMIANKLFNYISYIANIDIINQQTLHTGTCKYLFNNKTYYLRVSVLYSISSKSIVIRILNNHQQIDLNNLAIIESNITFLKNILDYKNGLVVLTGKTGAGKTTTLYAILEKLVKKENKKIISLEDPIEREIKGILQINVNSDVISYFDVLKQVLRHDPDIIIIGEIRDEKELKLAIQSALSGHLVITTMHAINAKYAINRLLELKVNILDLKACLRLISYQELIYLDNNNIKSIYEFIDENKINDFIDNKDIDYHNISYYKSILKKSITYYEGK